jgi:Protein of unknown function (DUF3175)
MILFCRSSQKEANMTKSPETHAEHRKGREHRREASRWSAKVTQHSDALDLEDGVFKLRSPRRIALSLKRSAEASRRRKTSPFRSALSMLTFYVNRAGANLSARRLQILQESKDELRRAFGRPPQKSS